MVSFLGQLLTLNMFLRFIHFFFHVAVAHVSKEFHYMKCHNLSIPLENSGALNIVSWCPCARPSQGVKLI